MDRPFATILMSLASVLVAGCAASPWSAREGAKEPSHSEASTPPAATKDSAKASAKGHGENQSLEPVMAELLQLGALDTADREKLLADMRQTDRSLWPMVIQQFRAAAAYRRQAEQRGASLAAGKPGPSSIDPTSLPIQANASATPADPLRPLAGEAALQRTPQAPDLPAKCSPAAPTQAADASQNIPPRLPLAGAESPPEVVARIPVASVVASTPVSPPVASQASALPASAGVVPASYEAAAAGTDLRRQLASAIHAMEAECNGKAKGEDVALQARLRMLYLLAGRREDALQPIPKATPAFQDYWSKQLYGLDTWLDANRTPDSARRAAETKRILGEAVERLGEMAPLVVRNLVFCTAVQSFGSVQPFKKPEFTPDQEVLLYAEVDNFAAESTPKGFHTSLRCNYQVFDSRGQRVAQHEFPTIEEHCQNYRHDFFIGYHLRLPKRIYPASTRCN